MSDALTKLQAYGRLNGKNADMPGWLNIHPKFLHIRMCLQVVGSTAVYE